MTHINIYIHQEGRQVRSFLPAGKDDAPIAVLSVPPGSTVDYQADRRDTPRAKQLSPDGAITAGRALMFGVAVVRYDPHRIRIGTTPATPAAVNAPSDPTPDLPPPTPRRRPRKKG
jgi:hypothetical protein